MADYYQNENGKVHSPPQPVIRKRTRREWGGWVFLILAMLWIGFWASRMVLNQQGSNAVQQSLDSGRNAVISLEASGQLTPDEMASRTNGIRLESKCGWVQVFMPPAPPAPTQGAGAALGGGLAPPDPVTQIVDYVKTNFKPDALSAGLTRDGQKVVIVAAWACP